MTIFLTIGSCVVLFVVVLYMFIELVAYCSRED
jgi:hypothetical protein